MKMQELKCLLYTFRFWITIVMLAVIQTSCANFQSDEAVSTWIPSENLPTEIGYLQDTDQPSVDNDGVIHEITQCFVREDRIFVRAKFSNPYSQQLTGIVALTVDSQESGDVWGFYEVQIPSMRSMASFDTNLLSEEDAEVIMNIAKANAESLIECSMHLIGFLDEGEYHVYEPVTYITMR